MSETIGVGGSADSQDNSQLEGWRLGVEVAWPWSETNKTAARIKREVLASSKDVPQVLLREADLHRKAFQERVVKALGTDMPAYDLNCKPEADGDNEVKRVGLRVIGEIKNDNRGRGVTEVSPRGVVWRMRVSDDIAGDDTLKAKVLRWVAQHGRALGVELSLKNHGSRNWDKY
jgi:hypothetical protein